MAEEHAGLYQALADHDPDRAAALAQDHLVTSRQCRPGAAEHATLNSVRPGVAGIAAGDRG